MSLQGDWSQRFSSEARPRKWYVKNALKMKSTEVQTLGELRSKFLTFIARSVSGILCETKEHSRSEMKSNRQTDRQTDPMKSTKVQTLGAGS